jgi:hypothetical protein
MVAALTTPDAFRGFIAYRNDRERTSVTHTVMDEYL